jgi:hypothetical protein
MHEPLSPELALVDPDLAARARAALPVPDLDAPLPPLPPLRAQAPARSAAPVHAGRHRPYPIWARITAALWLLVLGILIGGAAIPHAQDTPRIVPASEDPARLCELPSETPTQGTATVPDRGSPLRPSP